MKMRKNIELIAILMAVLAACLFTACDGGAMEELWKDELGNAADGLFDGDNGGDGPTPPPAPGKYRVIFDVQGHGTAPAYQDIDLGDKVTAPTAPTAAGYTFGGWYKETACTNAWNFGSDTSNVEEAITLYAKWTAKTYTITYMDETVEFPAVLHGKEYPTEHTYGTATTLKSASGVLGYNFEGWYKTSDCSGAAVTSLGAEEYTGGITLYAKQTPIANALSGEFSVASDKTVKFSPGNLYWDGSSFKIYEKQTDLEDTWNESKVDKFYWSKTDSVAYAENYSDSGTAITDKFFAEKSKKWHTLSKGEWSYLFNTRDGADNKVGYGTVCEVKGIILLPDEFTDPMKNSGTEKFVPKATTGWNANIYSDANWAAMEAAGAVFLPAAGCRNGSNVDVAGSNGYYWSATPSNSFSAYFLCFGGGDMGPGSLDSRDYGPSVRLVWCEN